MTPAGSVLLVDDEEKILKALSRALREEGHECVATSSPREAQRLLGLRPFDLLVVDNLMPERTGLELIRDVVATTPAGERPQILMMTAHATVESAIEAMKLGAIDYLQKPFEVDELLVVVRRALEVQRLRTQNRYLISERDEEFGHYGIVGHSRAIQEVITRAERVAQSREHGAHHRRDGDGQGAGRPRHPRPQRAAGNAADQGELRGHPGDAAGVGAVRPRARRLHRGHHQQEGHASPSPTAARSSSTRSGPWPRRCRASCSASCRSGSSSRWGPSARRRWTCA